MIKTFLAGVAALALIGGNALAQNANGCVTSAGNGGNPCPPAVNGTGGAPPNKAAPVTPGASIPPAGATPTLPNYGTNPTGGDPGTSTAGPDGTDVKPGASVPGSTTTGASGGTGGR